MLTSGGLSTFKSSHSNGLLGLMKQIEKVDKMTEGSKDIAFATYGEIWKYQKKVAVQALRQYLSGNQLEERIQEATQDVIENMEKEKGPIDLHLYLSLDVFNIMHGLCLGNTLADNVIHAEKTAEDGNDVQLTKTHTAQILADVFGAGVDTIRATLDWVFLVLVRHPDVQARIHEEINEVVGGYQIPRKTSVGINIEAMLRSPQHWEDPLSFKPERFLDETQTKLEMMRNKSFLPFSLGYRSCIGESLAKEKLIFIVVSLLQKFTFSLAPGENPKINPLIESFLYTPPPFKVVIKRR